MNTFDKNMENIFDVVSVKETEKSFDVKVKSADEPDLKADLADAYRQSKDNLQDMIDQGKEAMEDILQIARAGQHPRAFEVYGTLLKNTVEANDRLLKCKKKCETWMAKEVTAIPK